MAQAPNAAEKIAGTVPDVPRHVAIIMDGNGRWAAARGLPRVEGHRRGVEALRKTVRAAGEMGIRCLTIFSFSSENWQRPASEVRDLMGLLRRFIRNDLAELHGNGVCVRVIGEREGLDPDIRRLLEEAEELTRRNDGLTLVVAFNYGARDEIARAVRRIAARRGERRAQAGRHHRGTDRAASRRARHRRSRPDHPHQRRAAALELPAVAGRLLGARVHAGRIGRTSIARRSRPRIEEYRRRERRFGGLAAKTGS